MPNAPVAASANALPELTRRTMLTKLAGFAALALVPTLPTSWVVTDEMNDFWTKFVAWVESTPDGSVRYIDKLDLDAGTIFEAHVDVVDPQVWEDNGILLLRREHAKTLREGLNKAGFFIPAGKTGA